MLFLRILIRSKTSIFLTEVLLGPISIRTKQILDHTFIPCPGIAYKAHLLLG